MIHNYARQAPVTMAFSLVMVIIWLATAAQAGSLANNADSSLGEQLLLYPQQLTPVSIVGNMFMHFGAAHLAMNTIMLLLLGREIEMSLRDPWLYAAVFLVSGLGADAAIVHFHPNSVVAGVSGVLYSFMALLVASLFDAVPTCVPPSSSLPSTWPTAFSPPESACGATLVGFAPEFSSSLQRSGPNAR